MALISCCAISAIAAEPESDGLNELVILDPGVHELGLPDVQVTDEGKIEIPPTLHVHRFYYSGNKEYQGPLIAGGPTIVVAQHPKTSERLYVDVVLPPGSPVIAYNKTSITYVYPYKRVVISFCRLFSDKVQVKHIPGRGISRLVRDRKKRFAEKIHESSHRSRLVSSLKDTVRNRKHILVGATGVVTTAAATVVDTANQAVNLVPGAQALESLGQQAAERGQFEEIRQAGLEQAKEATQFIPTVR